MGYFGDAVDRVVLMQKKAITTPGGNEPDAYGYLAMASRYPYWCNYAGPMTSEVVSASADLVTHDLMMRLVIGITTSDFVGEKEGRLHDWMTDVLDYFSTRPTLRRDADDAELQYLVPAPEGATITGATGLRVASYADSTKVAYCDFTLEIPFRVSRARRY